MVGLLNPIDEEEAKRLVGLLGSDEVPFPYAGNPIGTSTTRPPQYASDASGQPFDQVVGSGALPVTRGQLAGIARDAWQTAGAVSDGGIAAPGLMGAIKVYHGSPHLFEPTPKNPLGEFRMDKIGTGEGNQAFGQGMYVAEKEAVAREGYRDPLSGGITYNNRPLGQAFLNSGRYEDALLSRIRDEGMTPQAALEDLIWTYRDAANRTAEVANPNLTQSTRETIERQAQGYRDAARNLERNLNPDLLKHNKGHMYEVNLHAEPGDFLHWDKPISEQSQHVQDVFGKNGPLSWVGDYFAKNPRLPTTGAHIEDILKMSGLSPRGAAEALRDAGIPGIRYLDATSRGKGQGTHNYAVFDPEKMEIIRRYGIAGLITGGATMAPGLLGDDGIRGR